MAGCWRCVAPSREQAGAGIPVSGFGNCLSPVSLGSGRPRIKRRLRSGIRSLPCRFLPSLHAKALFPSSGFFIKPIQVTLKPGRAEITPEQQMKGRVLDAESKPVSGAVVSIRGVSRGQSTRFGGNEDIDQVAVTDDDGMFVINGESPLFRPCASHRVAGLPFAKGEGWKDGDHADVADHQFL